MIAEATAAEDIVEGATVGLHVEKLEWVEVDEEVVEDTSRDGPITFELYSCEVRLGHLHKRLEILVEDLCFGLCRTTSLECTKSCLAPPWDSMLK